jgi:hypothetical protein
MLPCSLILAYQGLEEENLDQESPGPPGWGLSAAGQTPAHRKKKLAKKPIKILWIDATYDYKRTIRAPDFIKHLTVNYQ